MSEVQTSKTLPDWPKDISSPQGYERNAYALGLDQIKYERARAEAAIARLKLAVEALALIDAQNPNLSEVMAKEALRQIGELP